MWGDDAELFRPERWLDKARIPEHQAAFAAFSFGRRKCIGVVIAGAALCLAVGVWVSRSRADKGPRPPEYPGGLPLIGHAYMFASGNTVTAWKLFRDIGIYATTHGGILGFRLGLKQEYMITDPDACLTLANAALEKDIVYEFMKPTLGEGLLTAPVPLWKTHRKLLNPAFSQGVVEGFIGVFNSQAKRLVSSLNQEVGKKPFDFWTYIGPNALETICLTAMGGVKTDDRLSDEYMHATEELFNIVMLRFQTLWLYNTFIFNLTALGRKQRKYIKVIQDVTRAVLERKKSERANNSLSNVGEKSGTKFKAFIDLLLEHSGEKGLLSDREIWEEVNTFILAGHDTSASTTVYAVLLMGSHPDVQERVVEEIAEVLGDRDVEKQHLPKLVYLEAVLKETMRLYSIAPIVVRKLTERIKLKDYTLPAGSGVFLAFHTLHRHKMWGDDAELFRPERWLDKARIPEHQAAFGGFSIGRRMCIGKVYAMMTMKTNLVHLVRSFRFKSDVSKLQLKLDLMLKPHAGHHITVERRTVD